MSAEENIAVFRRFVEEVLNQGNPDAADQFFAPTLVEHILPSYIPGSLDGFKEWLLRFHNAFPDGKWTIDFITGTADIVAHHKSMVGTHQGEYMGVATTGKQVTTQETGIIRFEEGKMVEFWSTFDDFGIARQLGLLPED